MARKVATSVGGRRGEEESRDRQTRTRGRRGGGKERRGCRKVVGKAQRRRETIGGAITHTDEVGSEDGGDQLPLSSCASGESDGEEGKEQSDCSEDPGRRGERRPEPSSSARV
eukprot:750756-Hanusia_phi.AAC.9